MDVDGREPGTPDGRRRILEQMGRSGSLRILAIFPPPVTAPNKHTLLQLEEENEINKKGPLLVTMEPKRTDREWGRKGAVLGDV